MKRTFLLGRVSFSFIGALRVEIGLIVGISASLNTPPPALLPN